MTVIEADLDTRVRLSHGNGDHDLFAHYIAKSEEMRGYGLGAAVTALCGKRWVPTRDPLKFKVCPECKSIRDMLTGGGDTAVE
jgi:hypothetical protein